MNHNDLVEQWAADFAFNAKIDGYTIPKNIEEGKECVIPIKNKTTEEIIKEITKEITKAVSSYREYEKIPLIIKIDGEEIYSNREDK